MAYETKVLLQLIADSIAKSKTVKEAYIKERQVLKA